MSLLIPILIASGVVLYGVVFNFGTISQRITFIKAADDMNITLLELRRYEKNIILFREEENIKIFRKYLAQIDENIRTIEGEILAEINRQNYRSLTENIEAYKKSALALISSIRTEQRLIAGIRPLGRDIEKRALRKEIALDLRRHEKNYIIYREQQAVDKLHNEAKKLVAGQPDLRGAVRNYTRAFDSLTKSEAMKDAAVDKMRVLGRAIEKITMEFAEKERKAIDGTISASKKLFVASLVFMIISAGAVGCFFSTNIVRTLKTIEDSFSRLKSGDFNDGIDMNSVNMPDEIHTFVKAYNKVIGDLGASRLELEHTLDRLRDANRELVERQDELVEMRKMTAMRMLASEIAHEINNPLSSLTMFLGMLYEEMPPEDRRRETLSLMVKEAGRCRAVLKELADFAKKEPMELREARPAKLLREAVEIVGRQNSDKGITVIPSLDKLPEKAVLDPILVYQAMVNILANSYQFTPEGGNIFIDGNSENGMMTISIKDMGTGIPAENLPYIFEPFFSTRKELGGSGLGLAITKKIIERHKGSISVESKVGEETVFTIRLPVNTGEGTT